MKVALVHDWLITYRGGEKVLEALCELFPEAEIFTLFHEKGAMPDVLEQRRITTAFVDAIPFARSHHRHWLPLFPAAIEALSLDGFDLVVSSSHCVAKGVKKPSGARHLSYVHAPMRYVWGRFDDYFGPGRASPAVRLAATTLRPFLRAWDRKSARGVDRFVANSHHIAQQIASLYGRQARVVHPPVELDRFTALPLETSGRGGYFLWMGALAPYKRVDLAIEAFARLGLPLRVAGSGQEGRRLASALPKNVELLGQVSDADLPALLHGARALVFTGEEDFGLTPLEAQATGRPVIAFGRGGALETVTKRTGLFFDEQTPVALTAAVQGFEEFERTFVPAEARKNAQRFSRPAFLEGMRAEIAAVMAGPDGGATAP